MGYALRRAIRDLLPPDLLTLGERSVLLELADCASDETRIAYPGIEKLADLTGLTVATASKCLQRLAAKGIEVRVEVSKDKAGNPVFAAKGHRTTYRVPDPAKGGPLSVLCEAHRADEGPGFNDTKGGPSVPKGRTTVPQRADGGSPKGGPGSAPSPQEPLTEPSKESRRSASPPSSSGATKTTGTKKRQTKRDLALADVAARTDATPDEASAVVRRIAEQHFDETGERVRNIEAYVGTCSDEDLIGHLGDMRFEREQEERYANRRQVIVDFLSAHDQIDSSDSNEIGNIFISKRRAGVSDEVLTEALNAAFRERDPSGQSLMDTLNAIDIWSTA